MTLAEKIVTKPELERIDSSIESCIKIIKQELKKKQAIAPHQSDFITQMIFSLDLFKDDFDLIKGRKD